MPVLLTERTENAEKTLNELGAQGYEIIDIFHGKDATVATFKRPIEDEETEPQYVGDQIAPLKTCMHGVNIHRACSKCPSF